MSSHVPPKLVRWLVTGLLALVPGGCLNQDAVSSFVDLAASTVGGIVEILVKGGLTNSLDQQSEDPNFDLPISEHQH